MKNFLLAFILLLIGSSELFSQKKEGKVVQFSGYAVTADSLIGVPFAHITILNRGRVATAGPDGYFSFAAMEGDTIYFTCIGFTPVKYIIPFKMENDKFSIIQLMTKSDLYLPTTVIYPWGSRENFATYFKDLRLPDDDLDRAKKNLERERMAALGEKLEHDGTEAAEQSMRMNSAKTYYYGQPAPQNIFNPLAWAEFIRAWKRGDFKKKEKKSEDNSNNGQ